MSGRVNETAGTAGWATVDQVIRIINEKLKENFDPSYLFISSKVCIFLRWEFMYKKKQKQESLTKVGMKPRYR